MRPRLGDAARTEQRRASPCRVGCAANASSCPERLAEPLERGSLSRTPKTVRMITSSVIACMVGHAGSGSPAGQRSISRAATSAIVSS